MSEHHPIREVNEGIEHALHLDARRKLRIVAVIDIVKGVLVLGIALGILNASSHVLEDGGHALLRLLDLDPGRGLPRKFLSFLHVVDMEHGWLTLAAAAYAGLRFVEAYGLWFTRRWARWLGLVSSGLYVPFEVYYFLKTPGWATFGVLLVNLVVLWLLWPRGNTKSEQNMGNA